MSPRYHRAVERAHGLGPRIVAELLAEAGVPLATVERYAALDRFPASALNYLGATTFPPMIFGVGAST